MELLKELNCSFKELTERYEFFHVSTDDIIEFYGDEIAKDISDEIFGKAVLNKNTSVIRNMLHIIVKKIKNAPDKNKDLVPLVIKYLNYIHKSYFPYIISQIYDLTDETRSLFNELLKDISLYFNFNSSFENLYGKDSFKNELYKLGLQKNYYKWRMTWCLQEQFHHNKISSISDIYEENRTFFADVCNEIITGEQEQYSENVMYAVAFMAEKGDGKRELEAIEKNITNCFRSIYSGYTESISKYKEIFEQKPNYAGVTFEDLMEIIEHDEISEKDAAALQKLSHGISISLLSVLYDFIESAKKCTRIFMAASLKYLNLENLSSYFRNFASARKRWLKKSNEESINTLLEFLPAEAFFNIYCYENSTKYHAYFAYTNKDDIIKLAKKYPENALRFFDNPVSSINNVLWLDIYYGLDIEVSFRPLIDSLVSKSKLIRKKAFEIAEKYEAEIRPELEKILPKLKGEANINVDKLIKKWDNERRFGKDFSFGSNEITEEFCRENLNKNAVKKISWIDEKIYSSIRYADLSGTASPDVFRYIFSEYMILSEPEKLITCEKVAERLNSTDLQNVLENIYINWLEEGSDTKQKFLLLPYCIFASDSQILRMKKQLETWTGASRSQIAAFAVKTMAINGGSIALMTVDTISKKFKNNVVRSAAATAISEAAEILGISVEELNDKIIPKLDFDRNGERVFDYGERKFTVSLMPDFSLAIHDEQKNKNIKSLPKPNENDDAVRSEKAKKEFSELKKQIKTIVTTQQKRLEKIFKNGRSWKIEKWREIFEENAIMHCFAENLIWGVYENDKLIASFRYLSDGSFCNENDEEYELPENADITLAHPVELDEETREKWLEQLSDYEIKQPFPQIDVPVIRLEEKDVSRNEGEVIKYKGRNSVSGKISSVSNKNNLERGDTFDGRRYDGYYFTDSYLEIMMHIDAEELYFGQGFDEKVTISEVRFFKKGKLVDPLSLKPRFLSECMAIVESMLEN